MEKGKKFRIPISSKKLNKFDLLPLPQVQRRVGAFSGAQIARCGTSARRAARGGQAPVPAPQRRSKSPRIRAQAGSGPSPLAVLTVAVTPIQLAQDKQPMFFFKSDHEIQIFILRLHALLAAPQPPWSCKVISPCTG